VKIHWASAWVFSSSSLLVGRELEHGKQTCEHRGRTMQGSFYDVAGKLICWCLL